MTNDPLLAGVCSRCGETGYDCKCEQFHPNAPNVIKTEIMTPALNLTCQSCNEEIRVGETCNVYHERCDNYLKLSFYDALELKQYFYKRAGWMSPEFDGEVLKVIKTIDVYIERMSR